MKIKLLHIGLGKTGTNALSQSIFPEIEKKLGMEPSKPKEIKVEEYNKKTGNKIFEDIILK